MAAWDRMLLCLKAIRDEVGDAKPERPEAAAALLAAAQAAKVQAYAEQVRRMTSKEFIEAMKVLGAGRCRDSHLDITGGHNKVAGGGEGLPNEI